ncbi:rhodanese-like domain-containing protein [Streptomyces phaeofaciens]|uniref:rhodanese-like domain-containing protein n=1 Tax=Streptomyces phaeofaciens TaxID=68254 RepID=UPI0036C743A0
MPNSRITPARARRLLRDATAVLPDVREPDESRAGHAPGAGHVAPAALARWGAASLDVVDGVRDRAARGLPVRTARGAAGTVI